MPAKNEEITSGAMNAKAELERLLTSEVQKLEPKASSVTVSSDGQFAIYRSRGDMYQLRKLSKTAREFLHKGGDVSVVESRLFE